MSIAMLLIKNKMDTIYLAAEITTIESLTLDYYHFKKLNFYLIQEKKR
jgi:hypothetical protein